MLLEELVQELGYTQSKENWVSIDSDPAIRPSYILRRTAEAGIAANTRVVGGYVFHTSPDDPDSPALPPQVAIYVAEAENADQARKLHKNLWNLGCAPFLIVVLPDEVRVYKGFRYDQVDEKSDIISSVPDPTIDAIRHALSDFYAQEVDSGRIWQTQADNLSLDMRVDRRLLQNLNDLGNELVHRRGLPKDVAHALIGKYIYISYLRQREILSDEWLAKNALDLNCVLSRNATCNSLLQLVDVLERRFNGKIFPFRSTDDLNDGMVAYVASVFCGDEAESGQLALDFQSYDFSYIPIETLSLIYEQFLHREDKGKSAGAYYTPVPLAEYLICELNHEMPLISGMRVLDPCCGSGVFLVLAYRRLIDLESTKNANRELSADELATILQRSIFGVERNIDACYVTEFSLILTLLSHVTPPDLHHNEDFRFPVLHDNNIFQCDFFDDKSLFQERTLRFDWIIGNPPWITLNEDRLEDKFALDWIHDAKEGGRLVDLNRLCDAFCWRATEVLDDRGHVGLVLHAKSLTNERCNGFRSSFFGRMEVKRITNFSNLAYVLFAGRAEAPAATLVFTLPNDENEKPDIVHCGPFAINQAPTRFMRANKEGVWSITICQSEISTISPAEAECGNSQTWKIALWGSYRDKRAIQRLRRLFPLSLKELCQKRGWNLEVGLQLRSADSVEEKEPLPQLSQVMLLDAGAMSSSGFRFSVPNGVLSPIPEDRLYVRKRGGTAGLKIVNAPHMFVTSNFAAYSHIDFVLPPRKIGMAAPESDASYMRALSVVLNSSIARYLLFFQSSSWGVERSIVDKNEVCDIPVPLLSDEQVSHLTSLHERLSVTEEQSAKGPLFQNGTAVYGKVPKQCKASLQEDCDKAVERILEIPSSIGLLVRDFWQVRYGLNKGKTEGLPTKAPSRDDLADYATCLTGELDRFAGAHHRILLRKCSDYIVCTVEITHSEDPFEPEIIESSSHLNQAETGLWRLLKQRRNQWAYIQRGLRIFEGSRVHMYKSPRLLDWTRTQALIDADDMISEVLDHRRLTP
ncbi:MAG: HsdM family class I SAM-dependent methyltransferase [Armatimonadota bacterium]